MEYVKKIRFYQPYEVEQPPVIRLVTAAGQSARWSQLEPRFGPDEVLVAVWMFPGHDPQVMIITSQADYAALRTRVQYLPNLHFLAAPRDNPPTEFSAYQSKVSFRSNVPHPRFSDLAERAQL